MERQRPMKSRLSKQEEFEEVDEEDALLVDQMMVVVGVPGGVGDEGGGANGNDIRRVATVVPGTDKIPEGNNKLLTNRSLAAVDGSPPTSNKDRTAGSDNSASPPVAKQRTKTSSGKHHRLGKQGSSQGSLEGSSPALSRDSSLEQYTDSTGTDLQQFIIDTLHKNQKDRMLLLKIEQELINLVKDNKRQHYRFSQMSAYQRMLVHRVAAFFGLDHNVDQAGTSVIVNKTKNTRIPDMKFREQIKDELIPDEPKKSILKRDSSSFEEGKDLKSPERQLSSESRRSKSFEEREEEYGKARARIFNQDSSSSQEGAVDSPLRSHESTHNSSRRSSQEDLRWPNEPRPWSSTDSDSSNRPTKLVITKTSASTESEPSSSERFLGSSRKTDTSDSTDGTSRDALCPRRSAMPKASSFGGISVLVRTDSAKSASPRLMKAESFTGGGNVDSGRTSSVQSIEGDDKIPKLLIGPPPSTSFATISTTTTTPTATPTSATATTTTVTTTTTAVITTTTISMASSATSPIALDNPVSQSAVSQHSMVGYQTFANPAPSPQQSQQPVMWAVSSMESVPPGSILINPQTGSPYMNMDGTVYRHNPANTLPLQSFLASVGIVQQQPPPPQQQLPPLPATCHQAQQLPPGLLLSLPSQQPSQSPQPLTLTSPPVTSQPPFILCTPNMQSTLTGDQQQRHFLMDSGGGNTLVELSSQLSNLSFAVAATAAAPHHPPPPPPPVATAESLIGNETPLQSNMPSSSPLTHHAYGMPLLVSGAARPNGMIVSQQQQQQHATNVVQMPLYLVSNSQSLRYVNPFQYTTNAVATSAAPTMAQPSQHQVLSHLNPSSQLLEAQQQQQHSSHLQESPVVLAQTAQNPLASQTMHETHPTILSHQQVPNQQLTHQIQGSHCVPMVGYGQMASSETYSVSPYFTMAPQAHLPISSGGVTCPTLAYTVASLNLPGSANGNGGVSGGGGGVAVAAAAAQTLNPSHTSYASGAAVPAPPMCGVYPNAAGGNSRLPSAAPPPMHSSAYQHAQTLFRPQTPPIQLQGNHHHHHQQHSLGMSIGQQPPPQSHMHQHHHHQQQQQQHHHQTVPVSVGAGNRSFLLTTAGVATPSLCSNYALHSSSQVGTPGLQSQIQMAQQCTPVAPSSSQTPPLFNTYAQHVLTNLPLFRPNVRMMMRSNTTPPPSQNVMQQQQQHHQHHSSGNGQYATTPLVTKGYGIPLVDQRYIKTNDLYLLDAAGNVSDGKGTLTPSLQAFQNSVAGMRPPSVPLYGRGIPLVQGDMRLIGTPLQQMQPPIRIPMVLSQQRPMPRLQSSQHIGVPGAGGRTNKMRRQRSRGGGSVSKLDGHVLSTQSSLDAERGNHILQVQGFPDGLRRSDAERYLEEIVHHGAKLQFVRTTPESTPTDFLVTNKVHVYAVFDSETAAQSALLNIKTSKFQLRIPAALVKQQFAADRQQQQGVS